MRVTAADDMYVTGRCVVADERNLAMLLKHGGINGTPAGFDTGLIGVTPDGERTSSAPTTVDQWDGRKNDSVVAGINWLGEGHVGRDSSGALRRSDDHGPCP